MRVTAPHNSCLFGNVNLGVGMTRTLMQGRLLPELRQADPRRLSALSAWNNHRNRQTASPISGYVSIWSAVATKGMPDFIRGLLVLTKLRLRGFNKAFKGRWFSVGGVKAKCRVRCYDASGARMHTLPSFILRGKSKETGVWNRRPGLLVRASPIG